MKQSIVSRWLVSILFVSVFLHTEGSQQILALTCAKTDKTYADYVREAENVFVGRIEKVIGEATIREDSFFRFVSQTIEVSTSQVWKGSPPERFTFDTEPLATTSGFSQDAVGQQFIMLNIGPSPLCGGGWVKNTPENRQLVEKALRKFDPMASVLSVVIFSLFIGTSYWVKGKKQRKV